MCVYLYRDLETSKESEVSDARGKLQDVKTEVGLF